jgi:UDP-3-O-[3-hydroxymyristoyl] glucosamine N-acyltransferase
MPDPRFFRRTGPRTLAQLAEIAGMSGAFDPKTSIADVATLESATSADVVYVSDKKYATALSATKAGACFVTAGLAAHVPKSCAALVCADPRAAFAKAAAAFYPDTTPDWSGKPEIHPGAKIGPNAVIGSGCVIGEGCVIGANVTITHAVIGKRVIIHPGAQIGQDGFGFAAGASGPLKIPQLGRVQIHDDVEIGANCTIDRGALADTIIGAGTKLDNLVQIGHNVVLGRGCIVVAQAGIAGSCVIGDGVIIGPQAGLVDHLTIGPGAQIAGQSGVSRDVAPKETVMGTPAKPIRQFWREIAALARLTKKS